MSKIEWLREYRHDTGCTLGDALRAWDYMYDKMADDTKLRDATALAALQGMLAHATRYRPRPEDAGLHWHDALSKEACQIADAFIEARKAQENAKC